MTRNVVNPRRDRHRPIRRQAVRPARWHELLLRWKSRKFVARLYRARCFAITRSGRADIPHSTSASRQAGAPSSPLRPRTATVLEPRTSIQTVSAQVRAGIAVAGTLNVAIARDDRHPLDFIPATLSPGSPAATCFGGQVIATCEWNFFYATFRPQP
jgi:hypothetical protein